MARWIDWKNIFRWQWLAGLIVTGIVLSPMLIGLYEQFDLQPDKLVNGRSGTSGLRFFFWEQSFGRITGENVWKNDTGPFFFVHSFGWSFLPWTIGVIGAFVFLLRDAFKGISALLKHQPEWMSWGGFILPFIALSQSHYKLPHYIYVVFPMAAVMAAHFFSRIEQRDSSFNMRWINIPQLIALSGAWIFAGLIFVWFFPLTNPILIAVALLGLGLFIWAQFHRFEQRLSRFLWMSLAASLSVNVLMATWFYPSVLEYQASAKTGQWMEANGFAEIPTFVAKVNARSLDVYTHKTAREISIGQTDSLLNNYPQILIFTDEEGRNELSAAGKTFVIIQERDDYPATLLTMNFGNPQKRTSVLGKRYLILLKKGS